MIVLCPTAVHYTLWSKTLIMKYECLEKHGDLDAESINKNVVEYSNGVLKGAVWGPLLFSVFFACTRQLTKKIRINNNLFKNMAIFKYIWHSTVKRYPLIVTRYTNPAIKKVMKV